MRRKRLQDAPLAQAEPARAAGRDFQGGAKEERVTAGAESYAGYPTKGRARMGLPAARAVHEAPGNFRRRAARRDFRRHELEPCGTSVGPEMRLPWAGLPGF